MKNCHFWSPQHQPLQPRCQTQGANATAQHVAAIVHQLHARGLRQHHLVQRRRGRVEFSDAYRLV